MIEEKSLFLKNEAPSLVVPVREVLRELNVCRPTKVWVGCSGGLDSMALVAALVEVSKGFPSLELEILHVNYQLRGEESDGDEVFVREAADRLGLRCQILRVSKDRHPPDMKGVQEWARDIRFNWFRSFLRDSHLLALAHHGDDLVETILMRILRGAGLGYLQGMQRLRDQIWRPFLDLDRADLEVFAEQQKLCHRVDSSNIKLTYTRNRLRLQILPMLEAMYPGVRQNLRNLAKESGDLVAYNVQATQSDNLKPEDLCDLPFVIAKEHVRLALRSVGCSSPLTRSQSREIIQALAERRDMVLELNPREQILLRGGKLQFVQDVQICSARWAQYRKALLDTDPPALFTGGSWYHAAGSLEQGGRIVDNTERSLSPDLIEGDADDF